MSTELVVICGSSVEYGVPQFWALDTSNSRLFLVPEKLRVDNLTDYLYDFLGLNYSDPIRLRPTIMSKRCEDIVKYIKKKGREHVQQSVAE